MVLRALRLAKAVVETFLTFKLFFMFGAQVSLLKSLFEGHRHGMFFG